MKYLAEANWPLLDILIFSGGETVTIPDLPEEVDEDAPSWRQTIDEDEETYSSVEEDEDDG